LSARVYLRSAFKRTWYGSSATTVARYSEWPQALIARAAMVQRGNRNTNGIAPEDNGGPSVPAYKMRH